MNSPSKRILWRAQSGVHSEKSFKKWFLWDKTLIWKVKRKKNRKIALKIGKIQILFVLFTAWYFILIATHGISEPRGSYKSFKVHARAFFLNKKLFAWKRARGLWEFHRIFQSFYIFTSFIMKKRKMFFWNHKMYDERNNWISHKSCLLKK